jgi:UDP-glucose 4-epimerase
VLADGKWDAVFHFAALSLVGESMQHPFLYLMENAATGIRLIEACVHHGVGKFILSSTANLFGARSASPSTNRKPSIPARPTAKAS